MVLNGGMVMVQGTQDNAGTGGTITFSGGNVVHTFTASDSLVLPVPIGSASQLVVGGGGGGLLNVSGQISTFTGSGGLTVTSGAPASNYASWANDPSKGNIPGQPATSDFDNDGLTNLTQDALGKNPRTSSQPAGILSASGGQAHLFISPPEFRASK